MTDNNSAAINMTACDACQCMRGRVCPFVHVERVFLHSCQGAHWCTGKSGTTQYWLCTALDASKTIGRTALLHNIRQLHRRATAILPVILRLLASQGVRLLRPVEAVIFLEGGDLGSIPSCE